MSRFLVRGALALLATGCCLQAGADTTYAAYNAFLARYACPQGVAYGRIAGDTLLDAAARSFEVVNAAEFRGLAPAAQIAFLVNAYNFFTIQLVARHYPLEKGIRDIDKPWDTEFAVLLGGKMSLNQIEHEWLRKKYAEPRIHFALNCASKSCPALRLTAYTGAGLERELDEAARAFLSDTTRNRVAGGRLMLSQIFQWYGGDFKQKYGGYQQFVLSMLGLSGDFRVKFIPYDWGLNEVPPCTRTGNE